MSDAALQLPLTGLRVLDACDGYGEMCGRYLADLGADVILVEPIAGMASRRREPVYNGQSIYFAVQNANKRSITLALDTEVGRAEFIALLGSAQLFIENTRPGHFVERFGITLPDLREQFPQLVVLSITEFGHTGPYRNYQGTNSVMMALCGVLARSGIKGERPLLPPGDMAYVMAGVQAAWCALLACWQRLQTGRGDHLDFSIFESTAQIIDPGMGVTGSAAAGRSALELAPRGRPPIGQGYPIFQCADGHVRICILNPRQWHGMSEWLGSDHEFADPSYGSIGKRFKVIREINALIAALFSKHKAADLVAEGQRRGVPIAAVASLRTAMSDEHFIARGTFVDLPLSGGIGKVPYGFVEVDKHLAGVREPAPSCGQDAADILTHIGPAEKIAGMVAFGSRPLAGIRVLDLGVIVAGAELGRLFADQGAEVIKIESNAFADGLRQSQSDDPMTVSFAQGSRGKLSMGLNLRSERGLILFKQLVAMSDVVISNFKPGTMASLGLGYDVLRAINPQIICAESSALGSTGPRSRSMGYGPLVRAATGLTRLWCYPEIEGSYCDSTTIIPDHFAARVSAVAILSLLLRRRALGIGGEVSVSQAETILTAFSTQVMRESLDPGSIVPLGNRDEFDAPNSVFRCAGDDEWCVVAVRSDQDWRNLCIAIDRTDLASDACFHSAAGRREHRERLENAVTSWTAMRTPDEVMRLLQRAQVPAAKMQRLDEYLDNDHFRARNFFRRMHQPGLRSPISTENGPVGFSGLPAPELRPAPFLAQHTEQIARDLLRLSNDDIDQLVRDGMLEIMPDHLRSLIST